MTEKPPTKIYTYGLLQPTKNGHEFSKMCRAAHDYYNALLEIERTRQREEDDFWAKRGGYVDLLDEFRQLEAMRPRRDDPKREEIFARRKELRKKLWELRDVTVDRSLPIEDANRRNRHRELKKAAKAEGRNITDAEISASLDKDPSCVSPRRRAQLEYTEEAKARGVNVSGRGLNQYLRDRGLLKVTQPIDDRAAEDQKRARDHFELYYGTYLLVEPAAEQAIERSEMFPAFKPWRGEVGRVGAPVNTNTGISVEAIHNCFNEDPKTGERTFSDGGNTVLQIIPIRKEVRESRRVRVKGAPSAHQQGMKFLNQTVMRICVRSEGRVGAQRIPVWVEFPMQYHRDLPPNAKVTAAWVIASQLGTRTVYKLQLQVQDEAFRNPVKPCGRSTMAVNLGYRSTGRVAYALTQDGRYEVMDVKDRVGKCIDEADELRSLRDRDANRMRNDLFEWRDVEAYPQSFLEGDGEKFVPHWSGDEKRRRSVKVRSMKTRIDGLVHARDDSLPTRLRAIYETWERMREQGLLRSVDDRIFKVFREWYIEDKRSQDKEAHQRLNAHGTRELDIYAWAHRLCDEASLILVEDTNYATMKLKSNRRPKEELPVEISVSIARRRDMYAPGRMRKILEQVAVKRGVKIVRLSSVGLTQRHHKCGFDEPWDAMRSIQHKCEGCGVTFDQDRNFCEGLFERYRGTLPAAPARKAGKGKKSRDLPAEAE